MPQRHAVLETGENADIGPGLLPGAVERLHVAGAGASALDLRHHIDELSLADRQSSPPVDSPVADLPSVRFHAVHKGGRPPLEPESVQAGELSGVIPRFRHSDELHVVPQAVEMLAYAPLNDLAGVHADIDPDPAATKILRCVNRGSASAERIKNDASIRT